MITMSWTVAPTGFLENRDLGLCPVAGRVGIEMGVASPFGTHPIATSTRFYGTTLGIPSSRRPLS